MIKTEQPNAEFRFFFILFFYRGSTSHLASTCRSLSFYKALPGPFIMFVMQIVVFVLFPVGYWVFELYFVNYLKYMYRSHIQIETLSKANKNIYAL